jgi:hypothetical protein
MVVNYSASGDVFVVAKPRLWSGKRLVSLVTKTYDLAPDGKRIVALMPEANVAQQRGSSHVIFLENFFDELRRRVPVSGKQLQKSLVSRSAVFALPWSLDVKSRKRKVASASSFLDDGPHVQSCRGTGASSVWPT